MPRITIESKINVADSVNEIKTTTYEIPNTIVLKKEDGQKEVLSYDSYHKCYTNGDGTHFVSAKEYVFRMMYFSKIGKKPNIEYTNGNDDNCM